MNTCNSDPTVCDRLLRRAEAARYVADRYFPCSPKTLAKLACVSSNGPPFRRAGRIPLYPRSGLDAWAQSKIGPLVRSTSDPTSLTDANSERQTAFEDEGTASC
jgi:hypothetical protein